MSVVRFAAVAALALMASQSALAGCYRVYAANEELIYRNPEPPVDMAYPLHETLARVAPGASLVFSPDDFGCELTLNSLPVQSANAAAVPGGDRAPRRARADRG